VARNCPPPPCPHQECEAAVDYCYNCNQYNCYCYHCNYYHCNYYRYQVGEAVLEGTARVWREQRHEAAVVARQEQGRLGGAGVGHARVKGGDAARGVGLVPVCPPVPGEPLLRAGGSVH
jgi:hypothetical protein